MRINTLLILTVPLCAALAIASCTDPKKSARGFRLPDGDVDKGKAAFVALECHHCHAVDGVELPAYEGEESPLALSLGGGVRNVKNYGQLVTSIINPDHVISKEYLAKLSKEEKEGAKEDSPMPAFNDKMTVEQMIDTVAFLQSRYKLLVPEYDDSYYAP